MIPLALCGNIGLKPTFGQITNEGYEFLSSLQEFLFSLYYRKLSFGCWAITVLNSDVIFNRFTLKIYFKFKSLSSLICR